MPEYNANGRRTELVRGIVIEKGIKTPMHCYLQSCLFRLVLAAAAGGSTVFQHDPITLTDSEPEPDISVVAGTLDDFWDAHPTTALLAVEIADTTVELDRAKVELYAEAGVAECWLVLVQEQAVEVLTEPRDGIYVQRRLYTSEMTLVSTVLPTLRVELDSLFKR